jgi:hypothetical protein
VASLAIVEELDVVEDSGGILIYVRSDLRRLVDRPYSEHAPSRILLL